MKKLIALLLALAMLPVIAVSCGKEATTEDKDKTTPAAATETVEESKGGLEVTGEGDPVTFEW